MMEARAPGTARDILIKFMVDFEKLMRGKM